MIKVSAQVTIYQKEPSEHLDERLVKALNEMCKTGLFDWSFIDGEVKVKDCGFNYNSCVGVWEDGRKVLDSMDFSDVLMHLRNIAQIVKRLEPEYCGLGFVTCFCADGFIIKYEIDQKTYGIESASPNWLLTKSVSEMKEIQKKNY